MIQQSHVFAGAAEGFSITPFAAGHLVGSCAWRITTPQDEDIVYAVHYNHRKQVLSTQLACRQPSCLLSVPFARHANPVAGTVGHLLWLYTVKCILSGCALFN